MSKLGKLLQIFKYAEAVLPQTLALAGVPVGKIPIVVSLAKHAEETLGPGRGVDKLQSVQAGVGDGLRLAGHSESEIDAINLAVANGLAAGLRAAKDVHAVAEEHAAHVAAEHLAAAGNAGSAPV